MQQAIKIFYVVIIVLVIVIYFYMQGYFQEKGRQKSIHPTHNIETSDNKEKFHQKSDNSSTTIQESNAPQSPNIITKDGNVNITYGLPMQTISQNKEILKMFEKIKKKTITGVIIHEYVELLYDANMEMKNFSKNTKANSNFVVLVEKIYECYNSALETWKDGSHDALLQKGIVDSYYEAQHEFDNKTTPILLKKWQECATFLEEAKNIEEISVK